MARDVHKLEETIVPKLGALPAALVSTLAAVLVGAGTGNTGAIAIGAISMASLVVGLLDDMISLTVLEKVILGAIPFISLGSLSGSSLLGHSLPRWTLLIWAALVGTFSSNAVNVLAGFNGLEVGLSAIIGSFSAVRFILGGDEVGCALAASFVASYMAFLAFNFYPAKAFPGNGGTFHMGGFLAALTLTRELTLPFLVMMIPQGADFLLKVLSWRKTRTRGASTIGRDGYLSPPSHLSLVSVLLRTRRMRELDLVLTFYLLEVLLGLSTLLPLLVPFPGA